MKLCLCLLLLTIAATRDYPLYNQCDAKWANERLGNTTNTICKGGDVISAVAMGLAGVGINQNPSTLNTWLKTHKGYDSRNNFVWSSVNSLGVTYEGQVSNAILKINLDVGYLVIVNVDKGAHWALATGYTGNTIHVQNSLHPDIKDYDLSQIVSGHNAVYKVPNAHLPEDILIKYDEIIRMKRNKDQTKLVIYE